MPTKKKSVNDYLFGTRADSKVFDIKSADCFMPLPDKDGKIATLNQTGFMITDKDDILGAFIDYAEVSNKPLLEIGVAYGASTLAALEKGATVIANDIEMKHLLILRNSVPEAKRAKLYLNNNYFPGVMDLPDNSIGGALLRHVIHFLKPDEIISGFMKLHKWLVKDGLIFIVVMSPYHHYFVNFLPTYERRIKENIEWPGFITNLKDYIPEQSANIPDFLHVMDYIPLHLSLEKCGFTTEKIILFDYKKHPKTIPGGLPGFCGVIGRKI